MAMLSTIKKTLRKSLPDSFLLRLMKANHKLQLAKMYFLDFLRNKNTFRWASEGTDIESLRAELTINYHSIEKGLSNKDLRYGFGEQVLAALHKAFVSFKKFGHDASDSRYQTALSVVNRYIHIHEENNYDVSEIKSIFSPFLSDLLQENEELGGSREITSRESSADLNFQKLAEKRKSVRTFGEEQVSTDQINEAVRIARNAPSVCNRQAWNVREIRDEETIRKALVIQNGFRGLGQNISSLLCILTDNRYMSTKERNQGFIDGGLFSMSLLYALEHADIAACPLNACMTPASEKDMRALLNIGDEFNIIMFIAVGSFPQTYKVAKSHRDCELSIIKSK